MDTNKVLEELRNQRVRIEEAIIALERIAGKTPRRGRPPKWLAEQRTAQTSMKKRGRPTAAKDAQRGA